MCVVPCAPRGHADQIGTFRPGPFFGFFSEALTDPKAAEAILDYQPADESERR